MFVHETQNLRGLQELKQTSVCQTYRKQQGDCYETRKVLLGIEIPPTAEEWKYMQTNKIKYEKTDTFSQRKFGVSFDMPLIMELQHEQTTGWTPIGIEADNALKIALSEFYCDENPDICFTDICPEECAICLFEIKKQHKKMLKCGHENFH